nr:hypothetical protein SBE_006824 [Streptomyces sp. SBE_14.2]
MAEPVTKKGYLMGAPHPSPGHAARYLARAAGLAPSPHNSQPWFFAEEGHDHGFEIHLDRGRRLVLTDPFGREAVMACGAALLNVRLAVRHLGFRPVVTLLPDSRDSAFLAHVRYAAYAPATPAETRLIRAIPHRHTHRGPFGPEHVEIPQPFLDELCEQARAEGADLQLIDDSARLDLLAHLVRAGEERHRTDYAHTAEIARCVGGYGVPYGACANHPDRTFLPGRDYLGLARRISLPSRRRWRDRTSPVLVLTTPRDDRTAWLRAGQALQRVLLHTTAAGFTATLHTQPLELPDLRTELRGHITPDRHPQAILRLGRTNRPCPPTPRRPTSDVLVPAPSADARQLLSQRQVHDAVGAH